MSPIEGGGDLSSGEGGWEEARGGREGGEGIEGGAEGAVDGLGRADAIWGCEETNEYLIVVL